MISAPKARLQAAKTGSPDGDTTRVYRVPTTQAPVRPKHARRSIWPKRPPGPAATLAPEGPCEKSSPEPTRASGDKLSRCRHVRGPLSPLAASPRGLVGRWHSYFSAFHPARRRGCVLSVPCTGRVQKSKKMISAPKARLQTAKTGSPDGDTTRFYRVPTAKAPVRPTRARRSITPKRPPVATSAQDHARGRNSDHHIGSASSRTVPISPSRAPAPPIDAARIRRLKCHTAAPCIHTYFDVYVLFTLLAGVQPWCEVLVSGCAQHLSEARERGAEMS
jgi:hypothetical protein